MKGIISGSLLKLNDIHHAFLRSCDCVKSLSPPMSTKEAHFSCCSEAPGLPGFYAETINACAFELITPLDSHTLPPITTNHVMKTALTLLVGVQKGATILVIRFLYCYTAYSY